jgi:TonB family protein
MSEFKSESMKPLIFSLTAHIFTAIGIVYSTQSEQLNSQNELSVEVFNSELPQSKNTKASSAKYIIPNKITKTTEDSTQDKMSENIESLNDSNKASTTDVTDLNSFNEQSSPLNELIRLIHKNKVYPYEAVRLKQQGQVKISFNIDAEGNIREVKLISPCQYKSLNLAALQTIMRIRDMRSVAQIESLLNRHFTFTFDFELSNMAKI